MFKFKRSVATCLADRHGCVDAASIVRGLAGAALLAGALVAAGIGRASWKVLLLGSGGFSIALLALAPLESVVACSVLLFLVGVAFTTWTSNANSILQLNVPDHLRGRVLSLYLWAFAGLAPVGGMLAGWLADIGGTELSFIFSGLTGLVVTGLVGMRLQALRKVSTITRTA